MHQPGRGVHPLDPLTATEVAAVTSVLRRHDGFAALSERTRFVTISLLEPPKDAILAWAAGGAAPRREAEVVLLDRGAESTIEAVVSLDSPEVTAWRERTDIQPMTVVSELMEAEELVRLDPEFQAALARAASPTSTPSRSTPGRPATSGRPRRRGSGSGAGSPSSSHDRATTSGPTPSTG